MRLPRLHSNILRATLDNTESRLAGHERHVVGHDWLGETFERQCADVFEGDVVVKPSSNALAYQNLAILGFRA